MKRPFRYADLLQAALIVLALFIDSCSRNDSQADAYGNFESEEVIVSAQSQGEIVSLDAVEGTRVTKGQLVGRIDSVTIAIKRDQLIAQNSVIQARMTNLDAQLKVQGEQRNNLVREVNRMENLLRDNAATQQQYDDLTGKLRVLDSQTETIRSQKNIIRGEQLVLNTQLDEVNNQMKKCRIVSPIAGTVLEKYAIAGELVIPGKALFKVADMEYMELRVYVSGTQLPGIVLGDTVGVRIDDRDDTLQKLTGTVSWISSQVEFTPKIIQTREERVSMVYAVKIRVINDGRLKIGMPGEVIFAD